MSQSAHELTQISGNPPTTRESLALYEMICRYDESEARPGALWISCVAKEPKVVLFEETIQLFTEIKLFFFGRS